MDLISKQLLDEPTQAAVDYYLVTVSNSVVFKDMISFLPVFFLTNFCFKTLHSFDAL